MINKLNLSYNETNNDMPMPFPHKTRSISLLVRSNCLSIIIIKAEFPHVCIYSCCQQFIDLSPKLKICPSNVLVATLLPLYSVFEIRNGIYR